MAKSDSYNPADKYGWQEGDIEIIRPGTGEPLLSEEELERIIRENGPPQAHDKKKVSMEKADYTEDGPIPAQRCRHCTMFLPPDACDTVEGDIHPGGHCKYFEAKS